MGRVTKGICTRVELLMAAAADADADDGDDNTDNELVLFSLIQV